MTAEAMDAFGFIGKAGGTIWTFHVYEVGRTDLFAAATSFAFFEIEMRGFDKVFFCN